MDEKFSGYIIQPKEFNNIGIVIADPVDDRNVFAKNIAFTNSLVVSVDKNNNAKQIIYACRFLYSFSEKLILIVFHKKAQEIKEILDIYDDLDAVIVFNPLDEIDMVYPNTAIHVFSNEEMGMHFTYQEGIFLDEEIPNELALMNNPLWEEVNKIIQFI